MWILLLLEEGWGVAVTFQFLHEITSTWEISKYFKVISQQIVYKLIEVLAKIYFRYSRIKVGKSGGKREKCFLFSTQETRKKIQNNCPYL
jgi:hypothetical protein